MTLVEFEILDVLRQYGRLTAGELRDSGAYPESRTWQAYASKLHQLELRGFVHRPVSGDHIWDLTDRGREVLAQ